MTHRASSRETEHAMKRALLLRRLQPTSRTPNGDDRWLQQTGDTTDSGEGSSAVLEDDVEFFANDIPTPSPTTETQLPTPSPTPLALLFASDEPTWYRDRGTYPPSDWGYPDYDDNRPNAAGWIIGIVLFLIFLACFCVVSKQANRPVQRPTSGTGAVGAAALTNGAATLQQQPQTRTPAQDEEVDLVKSMSREQRREYVANFLRAEKFADQGRADSNRSGSFIVEQSKRNLKANDDAAPSCAICLEPFVDGEDICTSQNAHCSHQFHLMCAFDWLLTSQECPCCRRDYLSIDQPPSHRGGPMVVQDSTDTIWADDDNAAPSSGQSNSRAGTGIVRQSLTPQEILAASLPPTQVDL